MTIDTDQTCGVVEAQCRCSLPPHDDTTHVCDCGGSWRWDGETFIPLRSPGSGAEWDADKATSGFVSALFGPSIFGGLLSGLDDDWD